MDTTTAAPAVTEPLAFESFFEAERAWLLRALVVLTGNPEEAEELLQDTFIAVWERWDRVASMADPTGYLYRTAMNRHRSALRRATRAARRAVGLTELLGYGSVEAGAAMGVRDVTGSPARPGRAGAAPRRAGGRG
jgi:DNA-directed RNA polymerase specialized sigma24 family protein